MYAEYVGLTQEALTLIERLRKSPEESRSDILIRVLRPSSTRSVGVDLGQGVCLCVGERPVLFLSKKSKIAGKPEAVAEIRADGFYLDGQKIPISRTGNSLDPAMKAVQERLSHRNPKGEIIPLSAWRQWHVVRDGKLVSMVELKDPALARKRGRDAPALSTCKSVEELGLS